MALDDLLDRLPLYPEQTEEVLRARWVDWANEGLDPDVDVDEWTDTREGSIWDVCTRGAIREDATQYDLMGSEVPASSIPLWAWGDYLDDEGEVVGVNRLAATAATGEVTFSGPNGVVVALGTVVAVQATEAGEDVPEFEVTEEGTIAGGTLTLPVEALEAGDAGNVPAGAITVVQTPIPGVTVTNAAQTAGGTDTESDDALRARVIDRYAGLAVANVIYYRRLALDEPGVGRVTVIPAADGPGTISIIISTATGQPVGAAVIDSLQARVDPVPGQGAGEGQTGATITVLTAGLVNVDVAGTVEPEPGYSLLGGGGTIALQPSIRDAISRYLVSVPPGAEVVRQEVIAQIMSVAGVHDVAAVLINGVAGNFAVPASPPQAPTLDDLTLVEGDV